MWTRDGKSAAPLVGNGALSCGSVAVGLTHPCTNPNPQVNGPTIRVSSTHAKIRRDGYAGNTNRRR